MKEKAEKARRDKEQEEKEKVRLAKEKEEREKAEKAKQEKEKQAREKAQKQEEHWQKTGQTSSRKNVCPSQLQSLSPFQLTLLHRDKNRAFG